MLYNCEEQGYSLIYDIFTDKNNVSSISVMGIKYVGSEFSNHNILSIPEKINGIPVTEISHGAFAKDKKIKKLTLPKTLKNINPNAFNNSAIESVYISPGVEIIDDGAFKNCEKLKEISLPEGLSRIGYGAFSGCNNLVSITIPDSVTSLSDSVFDFCTSLKELHIGSGLTSIVDVDEYSFKNPYDSDFKDICYCCSNIEKITVSPDNKRFKVYGNILYDVKEKVLLKVFDIENHDTVIVPKWVKSFANNSFDFVCLNKLIIKSPYLERIGLAGIDIKTVYCVPGSNVEEYFKDKQINTKHFIDESINGFLNALTDEKTI